MGKTKTDSIKDGSNEDTMQRCKLPNKMERFLGGMYADLTANTASTKVFDLRTARTRRRIKVNLFLRQHVEYIHGKSLQRGQNETNHGETSESHKRAIRNCVKTAVGI
jgi:hypothetical protein